MKKRLKETYDCYLKGKMDTAQVDQRLQSYLGILSHANQHALSQVLKTPIGYERVSLRGFNPEFQRTKNQDPFSRAKFPSPHALKELPEGRHADTVEVNAEAADIETGEGKATNHYLPILSFLLATCIGP